MPYHNLKSSLKPDQKMIEIREKTLHQYRNALAALGGLIEIYNCSRCELKDSIKTKHLFKEIDIIIRRLQFLSASINIAWENDVKWNGSKKDVCFSNESQKWSEMFHFDLLKKNLRLYDKSIASLKIAKTPADIDLFNAMLYNLIDNAIKYSHWGTNIVVDNTPDRITITDYGLFVEESDRIYDLYSIGGNDMFLDGDGVGLYASKQAAKVMGMRIQHTCTKLPVIIYRSLLNIYEEIPLSCLIEHQKTHYQLLLRLFIRV